MHQNVTVTRSVLYFRRIDVACQGRGATSVPLPLPLQCVFNFSMIRYAIVISGCCETRLEICDLVFLCVGVLRIACSTSRGQGTARYPERCEALRSFAHRAA